MYFARGFWRATGSCILVMSSSFDAAVVLRRAGAFAPTFLRRGDEIGPVFLMDLTSIVGARDSAVLHLDFGQVGTLSTESTRLESTPALTISSRYFRLLVGLGLFGGDVGLVVLERLLLGVVLGLVAVAWLGSSASAPWRRSLLPRPWLYRRAVASARRWTRCAPR